jgi:hypothetical protein
LCDDDDGDDDDDDEDDEDHGVDEAPADGSSNVATNRARRLLRLAAPLWPSHTTRNTETRTPRRRLPSS